MPVINMKYTKGLFLLLPGFVLFPFGSIVVYFLSHVVICKMINLSGCICPKYTDT